MVDTKISTYAFIGARMDKEIKDAIGNITCKDCIYFNSKADLPGVESKCKRLDHKKYKFALPWFRSYDCGMYHQTICRDFIPNGNYEYLLHNWTNFDDWIGEIKDNEYVGLILDGDTSVRYYVKYKDFAEGTHIKEDGSLNWERKCYYKRDKESSIGYKLVWEFNNKVVSLVLPVEKIMELDYREEENRKLIQEELRKIKPLAKFSADKDIPFEMVEKAVKVLSKKYNIRIRFLTPNVWQNDKEIVWCATLENDSRYERINVIYALSIYEVFAKVAIYMYSRREGVGKREV